MKVQFFCPRWGSEKLAFPDFVKLVVEAGYDGVEMSLPLDNPKEVTYMIRALKDAGLLFIGQHWETSTANVQQHKNEYLERLHNLKTGNPVFINSQTGRDFFSFEKNMEILEVAASFTANTGMQVVHETHRGKFSFAAHITKDYLKANVNLRISADFSHWCNVAESMLEDQEEAIDLAIERADHIHARVGFPEGPQIPDPRAPEWKDILNKHLSWWDRIIARARTEGRNSFTITPEFGPYPYMTILPHSQAPISNQWEVNVFMMSLLKERYRDDS